MRLAFEALTKEALPSIPASEVRSSLVWARTHIHTHIHIYTHTTQTHIYTHNTNTHTHTHTHTHTIKHTQSSVSYTTWASEAKIRLLSLSPPALALLSQFLEMRLSSSRVQASDTAAHMRVLLKEVAAAVDRADTMKGRGLCLHGPCSDTASHMRVLL